MIASPLRHGGGPLYPVVCPVCGRRLGALYRDGLSLRAYAEDCTERCMRLWPHGRGRGGWRNLPPDLRMVKLATWMIDHETRAAIADDLSRASAIA
jgi:hypothetical protein